MADATSEIATRLASFSIPKIKKSAYKDTIHKVNINNRDVQNLLRDISKNCLDVNFSKEINVLEVSMIHSAELQSGYIKKRAEMRDMGRSVQTLNDQLGFLYAHSNKRLKIAKEGLSAQPYMFDRLGKSECGVYLTRFFDVEVKNAAWKIRDRPLEIFVFKYISGKCKQMSLGNIYAKNMPSIDPTPNYDSHIGNTPPNINDSIFVQMHKSSIYLYEYTEDCVPSKSPRHCLPFAIITLKKRQEPAESVCRMIVPRDTPSTSSNSDSQVTYDNSVLLNSKPKLSLATSTTVASTPCTKTFSVSSKLSAPAQSNINDSFFVSNNHSKKDILKTETVNTSDSQNKVEFIGVKNKHGQQKLSNEMNSKVKSSFIGTNVTPSELHEQHMKRFSAANERLQAEKNARMSEYFKLIPSAVSQQAVFSKNKSATGVTKTSKFDVHKAELQVLKSPSSASRGHNIAAQLGKPGSKTNVSHRHMSSDDNKSRVHLKKPEINSGALANSDSANQKLISGSHAPSSDGLRCVNVLPEIFKKVDNNIFNKTSHKADPRLQKRRQIMVNSNPAVEKTISMHNSSSLKFTDTAKAQTANHILPTKIDRSKNVKKKISFSEYMKCRIRDSVGSASKTALFEKLSTKYSDSNETVFQTLDTKSFDSASEAVGLNEPVLFQKLPVYAETVQHGKLGTKSSNSVSKNVDSNEAVLLEKLIVVHSEAVAHRKFGTKSSNCVPKAVDSSDVAVLCRKLNAKPSYYLSKDVGANKAMLYKHIGTKTSNSIFKAAGINKAVLHKKLGTKPSDFISETVSSSETMLQRNFDQNSNTQTEVQLETIHNSGSQSASRLEVMSERTEKNVLTVLNDEQCTGIQSNLPWKFHSNTVEAVDGNSEEISDACPDTNYKITIDGHNPCHAPASGSTLVSKTHLHALSKYFKSSYSYPVHKSTSGKRVITDVFYQPQTSHLATSSISHLTVLTSKASEPDSLLSLQDHNMSSCCVKNSFVNDTECEERQSRSIKQTCLAPLTTQVNSCEKKPLPKSISMRDVGIECYLLALGDMNYQPFTVLVDYKKVKYKKECQVCSDSQSNVTFEAENVGQNPIKQTEDQIDCVASNSHEMAHVNLHKSDVTINLSTAPLLTNFTESSPLKQNLLLVGCGVNEINLNNSLHDNQTISVDNSIQNNQTVSVDNSIHDNQTISIDNSLHDNQTVSVDNSIHDNQTISVDNSLHDNQTVSVDNSIHDNQTISVDNSLHDNQTVSVNNSQHDNQTISVSSVTTGTNATQAASSTPFSNYSLNNITALENESCNGSVLMSNKHEPEADHNLCYSILSLPAKCVSGEKIESYVQNDALEILQPLSHKTSAKRTSLKESDTGNEDSFREYMLEKTFNMKQMTNGVRITHGFDAKLASRLESVRKILKDGIIVETPAIKKTKICEKLEKETHPKADNTNYITQRSKRKLKYKSAEELTFETVSSKCTFQSNRRASHTGVLGRNLQTVCSRTLPLAYCEQPETLSAVSLPVIGLDKEMNEETLCLKKNEKDSLLQQEFSNTEDICYITNDNKHLELEKQVPHPELEKQTLHLELKKQVLHPELVKHVQHSELEKQVPYSELKKQVLHSELEKQVPHPELEKQVLHSELEKQVLHSELEKQVLHPELEKQVPYSELQKQVPHPELEKQVLCTELKNQELEKHVQHSELEKQVPHSELEKQVPHPELEKQVLHSELEKQVLHSELEKQVLHPELEKQVLHTELEKQVLYSELKKQVPHPELEKQVLHSELEKQVLHSELEKQVQHPELEKQVLCTELKNQVQHQELKKHVQHSELEKQVLHSELEKQVLHPELEKQVQHPELEKQVPHPELEKQVQHPELEKQVLHSELEKQVLHSELEKQVLHSELEKQVQHPELEKQVLCTELKNQVQHQELEKHVQHSELEKQVLCTELKNQVQHQELKKHVQHSELEKQVLHPELEKQVLCTELKNQVQHQELEKHVQHSVLEKQVPHPELEKQVPCTELKKQVPHPELEKHVQHSVLEKQVLCTELKNQVQHQELEKHVQHSELEKQVLCTELKNQVQHQELKKHVQHSELEKQVLHPELEKQVLCTELKNQVQHQELEKHVQHSVLEKQVPHPELEKQVPHPELEKQVLCTELKNQVQHQELEKHVQHSELEKQVLCTELKNQVQHQELKKHVQHSVLVKQVLHPELEKQVLCTKVKNQVLNQELEKHSALKEQGLHPKLEQDVQRSESEKKVKQSELKKEVQHSELKKEVRNSDLEKHVVQNSDLEKHGQQPKLEEQVLHPEVAMEVQDSELGKEVLQRVLTVDESAPISEMALKNFKEHTTFLGSDFEEAPKIDLHLNHLSEQNFHALSLSISERSSANHEQVSLNATLSTQLTAEENMLSCVQLGHQCQSHVLKTTNIDVVPVTDATNSGATNNLAQSIQGNENISSPSMNKVTSPLVDMITDQKGSVEESSKCLVNVQKIDDDVNFKPDNSSLVKLFIDNVKERSKVKKHFDEEFKVFQSRIDCLDTTIEQDSRYQFIKGEEAIAAEDANAHHVKNSSGAKACSKTVDTCTGCSCDCNSKHTSTKIYVKDCNVQNILVNSTMTNSDISSNIVDNSEGMQNEMEKYFTVSSETVKTNHSEVISWNPPSAAAGIDIGQVYEKGITSVQSFENNFSLSNNQTDLAWPFVDTNSIVQQPHRFVDYKPGTTVAHHHSMLNNYWNYSSHMAQESQSNSYVSYPLSNPYFQNTVQLSWTGVPTCGFPVQQPGHVQPFVLRPFTYPGYEQFSQSSSTFSTNAFGHSKHSGISTANFSEYITAMQHPVTTDQQNRLCYDSNAFKYDKEYCNAEKNFNASYQLSNNDYEVNKTSELGFITSNMEISSIPGVGTMVPVKQLDEKIGHNAYESTVSSANSTHSLPLTGVRGVKNIQEDPAFGPKFKFPVIKKSSPIIETAPNKRNFKSILRPPENSFLKQTATSKAKSFQAIDDYSNDDQANESDEQNVFSHQFSLRKQNHVDFNKDKASLAFTEDLDTEESHNKSQDEIQHEQLSDKLADMLVVHLTNAIKKASSDTQIDVNKKNPLQVLLQLKEILTSKKSEISNTERQIESTVLVRDNCSRTSKSASEGLDTNKGLVFCDSNKDLQSVDSEIDVQNKLHSEFFYQGNRSYASERKPSEEGNTHYVGVTRPKPEHKINSLPLLPISLKSNLIRKSTSALSLDSCKLRSPIIAFGSRENRSTEQEVSGESNQNSDQHCRPEDTFASRRKVFTRCKEKQVSDTISQQSSHSAVWKSNTFDKRAQDLLKRFPLKETQMVGSDRSSETLENETSLSLNDTVDVVNSTTIDNTYGKVYLADVPLSVLSYARNQIISEISRLNENITQDLVPETNNTDRSHTERSPSVEGDEHVNFSSKHLENNFLTSENIELEEGEVSSNDDESNLVAAKHKDNMNNNDSSSDTKTNDSESIRKILSVGGIKQHTKQRQKPVTVKLLMSGEGSENEKASEAHGVMRVNQKNHSIRADDLKNAVHDSLVIKVNDTKKCKKAAESFPEPQNEASEIVSMECLSENERNFAMKRESLRAACISVKNKMSRNDHTAYDAIITASVDTSDEKKLVFTSSPNKTLKTSSPQTIEKQAQTHVNTTVKMKKRIIVSNDTISLNKKRKIENEGISNTSVTIESDIEKLPSIIKPSKLFHDFKSGVCDIINSEKKDVLSNEGQKNPLLEFRTETKENCNVHNNTSDGDKTTFSSLVSVFVCSSLDSDNSSSTTHIACNNTSNRNVLKQVQSSKVTSKARKISFPGVSSTVNIVLNNIQQDTEHFPKCSENTDATKEGQKIVQTVKFGPKADKHFNTASNNAKEKIIKNYKQETDCTETEENKNNEIKKYTNLNHVKSKNKLKRSCISSEVENSPKNSSSLDSVKAKKRRSRSSSYRHRSSSSSLSPHKFNRKSKHRSPLYSRDRSWSSGARTSRSSSFSRSRSQHRTQTYRNRIYRHNRRSPSSSTSYSSSYRSRCSRSTSPSPNFRGRQRSTSIHCSSRKRSHSSRRRSHLSRRLSHSSRRLSYSSRRRSHSSRRRSHSSQRGSHSSQRGSHSSRRRKRRSSSERSRRSDSLSRSPYESFISEGQSSWSKSPCRSRKINTFYSRGYGNSKLNTCTELDYYSSRTKSDKLWSQLHGTSGAKKSKTQHPIDMLYSLANMNTEKVGFSRCFTSEKSHIKIQNSETVSDCQHVVEEMRNETKLTETNMALGQGWPNSVSQDVTKCIAVERNFVNCSESATLHQSRSTQSEHLYSVHGIENGVTVKQLIISQLGITPTADIRHILPYSLKTLLSSPNISQSERRKRARDTIQCCLNYLNISEMPLLYDTIEPVINTFGNPPFKYRIENISDEQILLEVNVIKQCQKTLADQQRQTHLKELNVTKVDLLKRIKEAKTLETLNPDSVSDEMLSKFESELIGVTQEQSRIKNCETYEQEFLAVDDLPGDLKVPVSDFKFITPKKAMFECRSLRLKEALEVTIDIIIQLFQCNSFGREHFRVPELLLLEEEKFQLYSRGNCFLILTKALPKKVFVRLLTLKNSIEMLKQDRVKSMEEKHICITQLIHERASVLRCVTGGNITHKRVEKMGMLFEQILDCQDYLKTVIGLDGLTRLSVFDTYLRALRYHYMTLKNEYNNPSIPEYYGNEGEAGD